MLAIPEAFFAIFSHSPRQSAGWDVSQTSKACCELKATTGKSRGVFGIDGPAASQRSVSARSSPAELGLKCRDARFQRLVFLARQAGHVLDRFELLAFDQIHVAQEFFGLVAPERVDLALDALGGAGGVVHQPADLVEKPVVGLGHGEISVRGEPSGRTMAIPAPRFKPLGHAASYLVMLRFTCNRIERSSKSRESHAQRNAHDRQPG